MESDSEVSSSRQITPIDSDSDDDGNYLLNSGSDSDEADQYSEDSNYPGLFRLNQRVEPDEETERKRPVDMDKFSRKRKRRERKWHQHKPIEYRSTADKVPWYLSRLPVELFTMIMDYLDLRDILYLCQDPEFSVNSLLRRHLIVEPSSYSILHQVIDDDWSIIPMIKKFMQILGTWNVPGPSDILPLNEAIVCERADLCQLFVEAGARVDSLVPTVPPKPSPTLLRRRGLSNMDHFISYEANPYWRPSDPDFAPLHLAAIVDNLEIVDLLLQHGADPNAIAGKHGSPLHLTKERKIAQLLITEGADVNAFNGAGSTPLFMAIASRREKLVAQLLTAGADANIHNEDNLSPLTIACKAGRSNVIYQLVSAGCDVQGVPTNPPLHVAVLNREQDIAHFLLDRGADVNRQTERGTALHIARCGEMAQLLLAYGADVDAQDADGDTPLQLAVSNENHEMFDVLVTAGADWKSPEIGWDDFVYSAVYGGRYTTVRLVLTHCNIKNSENDYLNPLQCAIRNGHVGIARLLIENDPGLVNQADDDGDTPIRVAMQCRSALIVELLAAGAVPTDSDLDVHSDSDSDGNSVSDDAGGGDDLRSAVAKALSDNDMDRVKTLLKSRVKFHFDRENNTVSIK